VNKELYIKSSSEELTVVLTEDNKIVEISKEKNNQQFAVGDIFLAKVKKIMPSLNAVFIDLGYKKDAFLHYHDLGPQFLSLNNYLNKNISTNQRIPLKNFPLTEDINKDGNIKDILKPGQKIIVQIAKEPINNKGPRLTSEITIAGRNLVLVPFSNKISISQKVSSREERNRLRNILKAIKEKNYGVIVRTVAEERTTADFDTELSMLTDKWEKAFVGINQGTKLPKRIIGEVNRANSLIRDLLNDDFTKILIDNFELYEDIKKYIKKVAPDKEKIVRLHEDDSDIFIKYGIQKQISSSFGKVVSLKSGAYLIIERTEALHTIDVNSGNRNISNQNQETNALEVNMIAAEEIARQLRLRDIGGIIVVDFIDMHRSENKQKVYDLMKTLLAKDKTKSYVLPLSRFSLMEITRQRIRPETDFKVVETCPVCNGTGEISQSITIIDEIENNLKYIIHKSGIKHLILKTHPFIAAYLTKGLITTIIRKWNKQYKCTIKAIPDENYTFLEYHFFDTDKKQLF